MKFYKAKHIVEEPAPQQINIDTNTDYCVGFQITKGGEDISQKLPPEGLSLSGDITSDIKYINGLPSVEAKATNIASDKKIQLNISSQFHASLLSADNEYFEYHELTMDLMGRPRQHPKTAIRVKKPIKLYASHYNYPLVKSDYYTPWGITYYDYPISTWGKQSTEHYDYRGGSSLIAVNVWVNAPNYNFTNGWGGTNDGQYWFFLEKHEDGIYSVFYNRNAGTGENPYVKELTIVENSVIEIEVQNGTIGTFFAGVDCETSVPVTINENSTSIGDLEKLNLTPTVNLAGIYGDDSTFSFNVYTK